MAAVHARSILLLLTACWLSAAACQSGRKTAAASAAARTGSNCADAWAAAPGQPQVAWQPFRIDRASVPKGVVLPAAYTAWQAPAEELRALMVYLRDRPAGDASGIVALPLPDGCQAFRVRRSGTMSDDLQHRYPDLLALQGTGITEKGADLRLEWNGEELHGQVLLGSKVYLLMPVLQAADRAYLIYDKAQTGEVKQPFEWTTQPAPANDR